MIDDTIALPSDTPTELYQLGIRYPNGDIVWGDPVARAQDAKARGYYITEVGDLHRHYAADLEQAHAPAPIYWPQFVYRLVTLEFSTVRNAI